MNTPTNLDAVLTRLVHDLRSGMTPALLMLGSMVDDDRLPVEARKRARLIRESLDKEVHLIDELSARFDAAAGPAGGQRPRRHHSAAAILRK